MLTSSHTNLSPLFLLFIVSYSTFLTLPILLCAVPSHPTIISFSTILLFCCVFLVVFNYVLCPVLLPACPNTLLLCPYPFLCSCTFLSSLHFHVDLLSSTLRTHIFSFLLFLLFLPSPLSGPSLFSSVFPPVLPNTPSCSCPRGAAEEQGTRWRGGVD